MSHCTKIATTLVVTLTAFVGRADAQHRYTVTDLGVLPGFDLSHALGVNDDGQVVGHSYDVGTNTRTAFVWTGGTMLALPHLAGGRFADAHAINASGDIVGQSETSNGFQSYYYGFLFDGGITALITVPNRLTQANDINDSGVIAGRAQSDFFEPRTAAVWTAPTMAVHLGGLIPGGVSEAFALNEAGWVVGEANTFDGSSYWYHAFVWDGTTMTDLSTFGGPTGHSKALDVNESNQVVGWAENRPLAYTHAFVWDGTTMTDLGTLGPNLNDSEALAINDRGQVVGSGNSGQLFAHAILWENGNIYDLNDLIVGGNQGWSLVAATDVSNRGHIVGYGYPPGGSNLRAFLLEPFRRLQPGLHVGP